MCILIKKFLLSILIIFFYVYYFFFFHLLSPWGGGDGCQAQGLVGLTPGPAVDEEHEVHRVITHIYIHFLLRHTITQMVRCSQYDTMVSIFAPFLLSYVIKHRSTLVNDLVIRMHTLSLLNLTASLVLTG
jgi:hypothetical protein